WVKGPTDTAYQNVAQDTSPGATGSFSYSATEGDGSYSFYTQAIDAAGNVEAAHLSADTSTLLDTTLPSSSANALPTYSTSTSITVGYSASDPLSNGSASGLAEVDLWVKGPTDSAYQNVAQDTSPGSTGTFSYT